MAGRARSDDRGAELVLAADQFLITPAGRVADAARARAAGDEVRTVIAGYHWFTDWGRDTMISLEGLTLRTGRHAEARYILQHLRPLRARRPDPEHVPRGRAARACTTPPTRRSGSSTPSTATSPYTDDRAHAARAAADARATSSSTTCAARASASASIPRDGLLRQGAEGYQLTWMDAKCDDWVVTPRRGKAVEINALWYNALRLLERWLREERGDAAAAAAARALPSACAASFNARFWYEAGQLSLRRRRRRAAATTPRSGPTSCSRSRCPTRCSSRSAGGRWSSGARAAADARRACARWRPGIPTTSRRYYGDLRTRDAAYHQGTVWGWLIGPSSTPG